MRYVAPFFVSGLTCIDFCNTLDHLCTPSRYDLIPNYTSILRWGQAAGVLPLDFQDTSATGERSIAQALETRSLLIRLLLPFTRSDIPSESDLAAFNVLSQEATAKMKIVPTSKGYALVCEAVDPLEQILGAVVRSTADLLLSNRLERVKQCEECGWWFYDTSRNQLRRWCNMGVCGNRAKARRHYERVKQGRIATT